MSKKKIKDIAIADRFFLRFIGLMGCRFWPYWHHGIYFPRCKSLHTFFTFVKPDILFLNKKFKILKIFSSTKPWRIWLGPLGSESCLELPSGEAKRLALRSGHIVQIQKLLHGGK